MAIGRGVLLGPYEALCAELMWFQETVEVARQTVGRESVSFAISRVPRVSAEARRRILTAAILHGQLDLTALGPFGEQLLETLFIKHGFTMSQREWTGEFLPPDLVPPFRRYRRDEDGFVGWSIEELLVAREDFPRTPEPVLRAVTRVMKRIGITSSGGFDTLGVIPNMPTGAYVERRLGRNPWPPCPETLSTRPAQIAMGIYDALDLSIQHGIPLLCSDVLAPEWMIQSGSEPQFEVIKAIIELPSGPQLPRTLTAASALESDRRLADLRSYVDFAVNRILTADSDAMAEVRREASRVLRSRKRVERVGTVAKMTTYIGLPVGVAEAVLGAAGPGLALGSVGFVSQGVESIMRRRHRAHWITL